MHEGNLWAFSSSSRYSLLLLQWMQHNILHDWSDFTQKNNFLEECKAGCKLENGMERLLRRTSFYISRNSENLWVSSIKYVTIINLWKIYEPPEGFQFNYMKLPGSWNLKVPNLFEFWIIFIWRKWGESFFPYIHSSIIKISFHLVFPQQINLLMNDPLLTSYLNEPSANFLHENR